MRLCSPKFSLFAALLIALSVSAWSMPAHERSYAVKQPDGTSILVKKKGSEKFHYLESADGYPLVRDDQGFLRYADENGKPSKTKPPKKNDALKQLRAQFKNGIDPNARPQKIAPAGDVDQTSEITEDTSSIPAPLRMPIANPNLKSGEKKALVVLVQFSDVKFSSEDPQAAFDSLLNQEGYNLLGNEGSVRDYFITNSMGVFKPHFDVVGPVTISGSHYKDYGEMSPNKNFGAQNALIAALDTLKKSNFDFSPYDNNGDKILDFVHMIYAGLGAHDSHQDSAIWPHKWIFNRPYTVSVLTRNNKLSTRYIYEYSCNSELDGVSYEENSHSKKLFGVGNFIHEFSHLLGLPDMYANDDVLVTPSNWDVMDMGAYNTIQRAGPLGTTPPYYSAFERLSLGWMSVTNLNMKGTVKLSGIQNNVALRVPNPKNSDEFFLMEYRSGSGWDKAQPYHGMLIWHIDYKANVWDSAYVNTTSHQHVDIVEADGLASYNNLYGDAFPGYSRVKNFKNFITWDSTNLNVSISGISESKSYTYVSFNVDMDADSGSISLLEGVAEDIVELSSSSEEDEEESSSSEAVSSSSQAADPLESSSSVAEPETSSSSDIESSSDAAPPETSSSAKTSFAGRGELQTNSHFSFNGSRVDFTTNVEGIKTLLVFSMNGQLLSRMNFSEKTVTFDLGKFNQPLLLSVNQGSKVLNRTLFIFRE